MVLDLTIDNRPGTLEFGAGRLRFVAGSETVEAEYSVEPAGVATFSLLLGGRSHSVTPLSEGEVSVDGRVYRVEVIDPRRLRARPAAGETQGRQTIAAQMPGRVIRVLVEKGQQVEAGEGLIVVEAMKMQNEMKSPKAGTVIEVRAAAGAAVVAGDALVVIE